MFVVIVNVKTKHSVEEFDRTSDKLSGFLDCLVKMKNNDWIEQKALYCIDIDGLPFRIKVNCITKK